MNQFEAPEPLMNQWCYYWCYCQLCRNFIFSFLSLIPYDIVQEQLSDNSVAKTMLTSTPKLTDSTISDLLLKLMMMSKQRSPITIEPFMDEEIEENEE